MNHQKKTQDNSSLNINSNNANKYDVIVVGSGMTGGWSAKEFTEAGFKTLLLERGRNVEHIKDYTTANMEPWTDPQGMVVDPKELEGRPVFANKGGKNKAANHFFVRDNEHPYIQKRPFAWVRGYQVGGKSLMWARMVQRWSDLDFEANAKDGHGIDWPIRYKDISPWYSHVEKFIGVSGTKDGLDHLPDGEFLPAFPLNCVQLEVRDRAKARAGVTIIDSRRANISQHHNGRGPCLSRNRCNRGCPLGGYYSSNSSTIPAAQATGNLTLRPYSIVHSIIYDEQLDKAVGVRVIDANTKEVTEYFSKVIFLNAGTLNSTLILHNSKSNRFPHGLGNENDILGRYLMDHDYRVRIVGDLEGFEDKYIEGGSIGGLYLPRFRNLHGEMPGEFLRGYSAGIGVSREKGAIDPHLPAFGAEFKESLFRLNGWSIGMGPMGECLPYHDNKAMPSATKVDAWGIPQLEISAEFKENENKMMKDAMEFGTYLLEQVGAKNVKAFWRKYWPFGNSIHEMGTARMGYSPKDSMLNKYNQIHNVQNVFVTDGACMTSSACQNPSLTYMALTTRAANYAIEEMKKQNL